MHQSDSWAHQRMKYNIWFCFLSTGRRPSPAADLAARRIRLRSRRRKRSAATALRRTRIAAGAAAPRAAPRRAAAPRAKRARRKGRRSRRRTPAPGPALAPGLVLDQGWRIAPGSLAQRAASRPRATTRGASPRGALAPAPAARSTSNPEPGPNPGLNPSPAPPHLPKPARTPAPPHVQSPAPNPAPRLVPVPAPSFRLGLFVTSPYPSVSPPPPTPVLPLLSPSPAPASCFLINSCRKPGTHAWCLLCSCYSISFDLYSAYFFIRDVSCGGVCKITGCNLSFISLNDDMVCVRVSLAFF